MYKKVLLFLNDFRGENPEKSLDFQASFLLRNHYFTTNFIFSYSGTLCITIHYDKKEFGIIHHGLNHFDDIIRDIIYLVRKNFKQIFLVNPCIQSFLVLPYIFLLFSSYNLKYPGDSPWIHSFNAFSLKPHYLIDDCLASIYMSMSSTIYCLPVV